MIATINVPGTLEVPGTFALTQAGEKVGTDHDAQVDG